MDIIDLPKDIYAFGKRVTTFPAGIGEAFGELMHSLENGNERAYWGISHLDDAGNVIYHAAAEEIFSGEAAKYKYTTFVIETGNYLAVSIKDWRIKLECISAVFQDMMQHDKADLSKPCFEWYKTDEEMFCMMKSIDQEKQ
jgi:hypothetical protein